MSAVLWSWLIEPPAPPGMSAILPSRALRKAVMSAPPARKHRRQESESDGTHARLIRCVPD